MISIPYKAKQFLVFTIKLLIVTAAFYFIYDQLANNDKLDWNKFEELVSKKASVFGILFILLFSFLNRFLEILKWQNLVSVIKKISIFEATKQVLAALTAGIFTPNGIGEYAGKALYYPKFLTKKIIFLNLICNGIQVIITIFFGTVGLFVLGFYKIGIFILLILISLIILIYTSKNIKIKGYSIERIVFQIDEISNKVHQKNIVYGLLRYLILMNQFYFIYNR